MQIKYTDTRYRYKIQIQDTDTRCRYMIQILDTVTRYRYRVAQISLPVFEFLLKYFSVMNPQFDLWINVWEILNTHLLKNHWKKSCPISGSNQIFCVKWDDMIDTSFKTHSKNESKNFFILHCMYLWFSIITPCWEVSARKALICGSKIVSFIFFNILEDFMFLHFQKIFDLNIFDLSYYDPLSHTG